jgi:uncharacterized OB-fold protein
LRDNLLSAAVFVAILGASWFITNWFARAMYIRCAACGTLNARRRVQCRSCQKDLRAVKD